MRTLKREPAESMATVQLRNAILSGSLRPGARLRQEELAARLGVSRMPVRQALSVLEREGLVKTEPWRGTVVALLDGETIRDLYAFRAIVERYVAQTLADQSSFDASAFKPLVKAGRSAILKGDLARLIELDLQFHSRLYEAIGNRILSQVMREQWAHVRRVMALTLTVAGYRKRVWDEHAGIVDAIEAHDPEGAARLAHAHVTAASALVMKNFDIITAGSDGRNGNQEEQTPLREPRTRGQKTGVST
jgi:DNA-binding GntR family transcriptional regulator